MKTPIRLFIFIALSAGLLFAGPEDEIISLSKQGKVKEAIGKYHNCFLQEKQHNPRLIEEIFFGFLRNTDSKYGYATRRDAGQIIVFEVVEGKRDKEKVIKIFRENLNSPDTGVKVNAVKFLILLGYRGEDLFPALREGLDKGGSAVSLDAALLLGSFKSEEAISLLEEGMKNSNPLVAIASVRGLGKIGGAKATSLLINGLRGRISSSIYTSEQIKLACARSLSEVGGRDATLALGEALNSRDKRLKKAALNALGKIALRKEKRTESGGWLKGWFKKEVTPLPYIKSAFKDEAIKENAAKVLLELGEKEGVDFFKERLIKGNIKEKLEAASLLAKKEDKSGIKIIDDALQNNDKKIRRKGVESLKEFGNDALPLLKKASHDPEPAIRMKVIDIAKNLGKEGEEIIVALTMDSDSGVKTKASFAFAGVELTGVPALDLLLEEGLFGLKVRRSDLAKLKNREETISRIKGIINSQNKYSKVELAEVLLYIGERDISLPILRDALTWSKAPRYQKKAAFALASIKDKTCLPFLEERFFRYGYAEVETVKAFLKLVQPSSYVY